MRIRKIDISDPAARTELHILIAECFDPGEWSGERLPTPHTGDWWVAFDGTTPVAFAGLTPSVRWESTGYLNMAGVLPASRGKGLQKRLIKKRVEQAKKYGWHTVITDTINTNAPSMRSLIACGFRPYIPLVKWGDPDHAVYWRRPVELDRRAP